MSRNLNLANRLREVLLDGHWIANTNYKQQLQSISWQQAIQQVNKLNSIAALTYHINYYIAGILSAFESGELSIRDQYSFDLPPINSAQEWQALIDNFLSNAATFASQIELMNDAQFDQPFFDEKYGSYWRNIEGVIEHCYYHLGQISLIKKIILEQNIKTSKSN